jgi:hypothetical protein
MLQQVPSKCRVLGKIYMVVYLTRLVLFESVGVDLDAAMYIRRILGRILIGGDNTDIDTENIM